VTAPRRRDVRARLDLDADGPARLALAIAVAKGPGVTERLEATQDGIPLEVRELPDRHGGRLHLVDVAPGPVRVEYAASVEGALDAPTTEPLDGIEYLRPSRYCESDALAPTADAEFAGLQGAELLAAVRGWVGSRLDYVLGSSLPTDGAIATLLGRRGVCRDFAHLVVALLRARDVPARVVSVYAPGLEPMDFHAVAEALVDGSWRVVDATGLAPRGALVRIATGRDAADTAFLTSIGAAVSLTGYEVMAVADALPDDDGTALVELR